MATGECEHTPSVDALNKMEQDDAAADVERWTPSSRLDEERKDASAAVACAMRSNRNFME